MKRHCRFTRSVSLIVCSGSFEKGIFVRGRRVKRTPFLEGENFSTEVCKQRCAGSRFSPFNAPHKNVIGDDEFQPSHHLRVAMTAELDTFKTSFNCFQLAND